MDIEQVTRQIRSLRILVSVLSFALLVLVLLLIFLPERKVFDSIDARMIRIVDTNGVARLVLAARLPNPIVQGKEYQRSHSVTGIQLNDSLGNERGGIGLIDRIDGALLCFDYGTAEALCIVTLDKMNYTGIVLLEKPKEGSAVGKTGAERLFFAIENKESKILVNDSEGKERIKLSVDSADVAKIEMFDKTGKLLLRLPK